ncbi:MAG: aminoglycoside phosphotransferase family protein [Chitinophagaceae bacterium]|nr:aminoglycoside phosphotransferase family protein [Chitinophagaceae bacterium]
MINRKHIYYWKSDRPHTLLNTHNTSDIEYKVIEAQLREYLNLNYRKDLLRLTVAEGQGDHITYIAHYPDREYFIRLENGPEKDDYMMIESAILKEVKALGVPSPAVFLTDTSRSQVPFAIQVMERIVAKDLNELDKYGTLDTTEVAVAIGTYIAKWQDIKPLKYGLFNSNTLSATGTLEGYHSTYADYFYLNWDVHLDFLCSSGFISESLVAALREILRRFDHLLELSEGCLVHKDLALWNILGSNTEIIAFIDWADAISGDPTDDLSLLACFHPGEVVLSAIEGYKRVRRLPVNFEQRFWLHLLRNIIFKAVIRVKGDYFDKPGNFFLLNPRQNDLKQFTLDRIDSAYRGLKGEKDIGSL